MKKWQKRSLAAVLAVLMALSCIAFGVTAFAADYVDYAEGISLDDLEEGDLKRATFVADGSIKYYPNGSSEKVTKTIPKLSSAGFAQEQYVYNGHHKTPTPIVLDAKGNRIPQKYIRVAYEDKWGNIAFTEEECYNRDVGIVVAHIYVEGLYNATSKKTFQIIPAKMAAPTVTNAAKGFKISWKKAPGGVHGYEIWRKKGSGGFLKVGVVEDADTLSYVNATDAANTAGVKYQYKVRAYRNDYSLSLSDYSMCYGVFSDPTECYKPAAPTVINAVKGFKISWKKAPVKADGYEVWRKKGSGDFLKVGTIKNASTTEYTNGTDAANANGVKYAYKIRTFKTVNGKNVPIVTSPEKVSYKVARPAAPAVKNSGSGKISVSWTKNAKASGYKVKYVTGSSTKIAEVKGADMTGITLTVNKKAKYSVYVQAYKTVSGKTYHSCFSPAKTITTT